MKKIRALMSLTIALTLILNCMSINVNAQENALSSEVVYVDGVKYEVSIDNNYNIIVEGSNYETEATMVLNSNLEGNISISDNEMEENYSVEIASLESNDVVNVESIKEIKDDFEYDDVEIIITDTNDEDVLFCDDIDELLADEYEGQASIAISAGVITVSGMLTALIKASIVVTVAGVTCYAVDKIIEKVKKKSKQYYYKAYRCANTVVINPYPISKASAVSLVLCGADVYTYKKSFAKSVMKETYLGYYGPENHWKPGKVGFFFNHYHLNLHKKGKNSSHVFYGVPVSS